jgi:CRP-like cAMP-binding protein
MAMKGSKKLTTLYKKGDIIYNVGDEQNNFYIIDKGKVQILLGDNQVVLVTLVTGDFFGEESLNENQDAAYTIEVLEDSEIIKISYSSLKEMMNKNREISLKILKKLSDKNLKIFNNLLNLKAKSVTPERIPKTNDEEDEITSEKLNPDIKAYLIIQRSNRIVQLTKMNTFLGRRDYTTGFVPDVDLTKEDEEKYISRKHAKISYSDGKFFLSEEPGAINGTFLNGTKLNTGVKYELNNEDEATLCHLNIIFKY